MDRWSKQDKKKKAIRWKPLKVNAPVDRSENAEADIITWNISR